MLDGELAMLNIIGPDSVGRSRLIVPRVELLEEHGQKAIGLVTGGDQKPPQFLLEPLVDQTCRELAPSIGQR